MVPKKGLHTDKMMVSENFVELPLMLKILCFCSFLRQRKLADTRITCTLNLLATSASTRRAKAANNNESPPNPVMCAGD